MKFVASAEGAVSNCGGGCDKSIAAAQLIFFYLVSSILFSRVFLLINF